MLLGYVAAYFQNASSWSHFDQRAILPAWLKHSNQVKFATKGPCTDYTPVHGYDTRSSVARAEGNKIDWTTASCVAGWTAGNVLMSASAAANWYPIGSVARHVTAVASGPLRCTDLAEECCLQATSLVVTCIH